MIKIDITNPKLTTLLVFAIVFLLVLLYPLVMQTENDYVFYTHYFFYFAALLFLVTWNIRKGFKNRTVWFIFGLIFFTLAVLIHLASLYIIALGKGFQH